MYVLSLFTLNLPGLTW